MEIFKKGPQPLKRFNAIDPRIDYSSSAYMNVGLMLELEDKMTRIHENRQKNPEKWSEYADALQREYVPTTTFTWDQEAEDSFPIELPHKPLWLKRGHNITHINTDVNVPHDGTIDAGWKYRQICWNPDPPLTTEQLKARNDSSLRADDEEGIHRRFEELRVLYGVSVLENLEEEIASVNEDMRLSAVEDEMNNIKLIWRYFNNKIDYKKQEEEEEEEEEDPWPPQIKNQPERSEQLLDEWYLAHPPKLRREVCLGHLEVERYNGMDKRLEWLSGLTVEEEDNEEKNNETFGL
jgi:hypothetical protein